MWSLRSSSLLQERARQGVAAGRCKVRQILQRPHAAALPVLAACCVLQQRSGSFTCLLCVYCLDVLATVLNPSE